MRSYLLLFLLLFLTWYNQSAFGSLNTKEKAQQIESEEQQRLADSVSLGFEAIYNFRFSQADSISKELQLSHPNHPWTRILTVNYYWWQIITGEDSQELRKEYVDQLNNALKSFDGNKATLNDLDRYTLITLYGFKARIEILNKRYIVVVSLLNNYISNLKGTFGKEEEFEWYNLTSGIYNYYIERSKKTHPFLKPYLGLYPNGNIEKGLQQLESARQSNNILLSTEAEYFLMKIHLGEETKLDAAEKNAAILVDRFPDNAFYRYMYYTVLLKQKKLSEAMIQYGQLSVRASSNTQLSPEQQSHFSKLAKQDLTRYYIEEAKEAG